MNHWKFACTDRTETECFLRNLFGDADDRVRHVEEGDRLFLHNVESGTVYGPFVARSGVDTHEPTAWRHLATFEPTETPYRHQVRIGWDQSVYRAGPGVDPEDVRLEPGFQHLLEAEAEALVSRLEEGELAVLPDA